MKTLKCQRGSVAATPCGKAGRVKRTVRRFQVFEPGLVREIQLALRERGGEARLLGQHLHVDGLVGLHTKHQLVGRRTVLL